ncbi:unnamed protein product [Closterium sp. NIES-64]|nr:unnamed protein product [Closterium sp. NIES-64]
MTSSASPLTSHLFSPPSLSSPSLSSTSARSWLLAAGASFSLVAAFSGTATVAAKERPEVDLGRDAEVVLYQYEACPFCNKVKAFLDYHHIRYRVVEVNPRGQGAFLDYYDISHRVLEVNPVGKKAPVVVVSTPRVLPPSLSPQHLPLSSSFLFLPTAAFLDYYDIPYRVVEVNPVGNKVVQCSSPFLDHYDIPYRVVEVNPSVGTFLDYYDIPYRVVEVNPVGKKELKWSPYKKVPVLVVNGESLVDSSAIISELHRRLNPSKATNIPPATPAASAAAASAPGAYASAIGGGSSSSAGGTSSSGGGGVAEGVAEVVGHVGERGVAEGQAEEELDEETRWRRWVDGHLVHLLSPNIYRSPSEALEAFDYIATNGNFTAWERMMARYFGAGAMYMIGKKLKKKHGIADERTDLYKAADEWVAALGDRKFLGGKTPNLADLAVFGVLRPIRHLTAGRDMVANSSIGPWYERMEQHVGASARITAADGAAVTGAAAGK